ncbi:MAG: DUF1861 family protein [Sporolactobacillus sp.]
MFLEHATECTVLLEDYLKKDHSARSVKKLTFAGAGDKDVYNISAPFMDEAGELIAGRIEARDSEDAIVGFFEEEEDVWNLREDLPMFPLQDPFVTRINGLLVFGGVEVIKNSDGGVTWRTILYKGKNVKTLARFFEGPVGMKDLRLGQLIGGSILVLTRPQGLKGGRGKIGYFMIDSLDELDCRKIEDAPLLQGHFAEGEWGGANEILPLRNGDAGVLGHIAYFDEKGDRHYFPMTFAFDPSTGFHTPIELIATRSHFLDGPSKREDLKDIVFSGGGLRQMDGTFVLYAGTSDTEAQTMVMGDPFVKYETDDLLIENI